MDALERVRGRACDRLAGIDIARERDETDVRVLHDRLADGNAVAGDDVEHARREHVLRELGEAEQRERCLLGRLQDLDVARRQRGRELPDRHHQRVVPGCDPAHDPDRLAAQHRRVAPHVLARGLPLRQARCAREEAQVVRADRDLVASVGQRLAHVSRLEGRYLLGVLVEHVRQPEQHLGALGRRRLEPLRQRPLRRRHGPVDVLCRPARNLGDRLAGRRVQHLHRRTVGRVDPLTADEVLVARNSHAQFVPPCRLRRA